VELPPIGVYQVGEAYFVKEGNHRVAPAKATGQKYMDAYVIALDVPVPVEPGDTVKDLILKAEYAHFLEKTRLKELIPEAEEIRFTTLGRYDILLDHIATKRYFPGRTEADLYLWVMDHRHFLAQEGQELSPEEAARSYEERFGPLWKQLGGALKRFLVFKTPGQT
jgi:hypothetical protein